MTAPSSTARTAISTPRPETIDAVRELYRAAASGDLDTWMRLSLDAIAPLVDLGRGVLHYHYDLRGPPAAWRAEGHVARGLDDDFLERSREAFHGAPPRLTGVCHHFGPVALFSELVGFALSDAPEPNLRSAPARDGVFDVLGVNASNPDGTGVMCAVPCPDGVALPLARRRWLARLSAHMAAARRLVDVFARGAEPRAILDEGGRIAHVEGDALRDRERLSAWVARVERTRAGRPGANEEVLVAWDALVAGRYSMVDRFERDGRRFVLAYANPPDAPDPRGLTPRERAIAALVARGHALKLVAYELGVSVGTVTSTLSHVLAKLGLRNRTELVWALRPPDTFERVESGPAEVLVFSSRPGEIGWPPILTPAEREVASATAAGRTVHEIAAERSTSERTIANQLASIYRKLGVASRSELVSRFAPP
ncbi:MAG: hypothetical protein IT385_30085 [Deltaproteobacteria bacterium]|nr:hypothetical protein [Deltaproteobacteria bacterium]